jgi:hypothetical protein
VPGLDHDNRSELQVRSERLCWLVKRSVNGHVVCNKTYDEMPRQSTSLGREIDRWQLTPREQTLSLFTLERLANSGNLDMQRVLV